MDNIITVCYSNDLLMHEYTGSNFLVCKLCVEGGTRVRRGYFKEALIDDKEADVGHVVFVVHGIGQKMDTGSIVGKCAE